MKEKKQPRQVELTYSERVILAAMLWNETHKAIQMKKYIKNPRIKPEELIEIFNKVSDVKWSDKVWRTE